MKIKNPANISAIRSIFVWACASCAFSACAINGGPVIFTTRDLQAGDVLRVSDVKKGWAQETKEMPLSQISNLIGLRVSKPISKGSILSRTDFVSFTPKLAEVHATRHIAKGSMIGETDMQLDEASGSESLMDAIPDPSFAIGHRAATEIEIYEPVRVGQILGCDVVGVAKKRTDYFKDGWINEDNGRRVYKQLAAARQIPEGKVIAPADVAEFGTFQKTNSTIDVSKLYGQQAKTDIAQGDTFTPSNVTTK